MGRSLFFLFCVCCGLIASAAEVVVVCPSELQHSFKSWLDFRRAQGHQIRIVSPGESVEATCHVLRRSFATTRPLRAARCVVLVGDGSTIGPTAGRVDARVIQRWGPESDIATDMVYADLDQDGLPELSVGRLPFNTRPTLEAYLQRLIAREQESVELSDLDLRLVAGVGGFSPWVDAAVEATARRLVERLTPDSAAVSLTRLNADHISSRVAWQALRSPGGVWVYLGHGLRDRLAGMHPNSPHTALSKNLGLTDESGSDAAVLIACYAGAFETSEPCFAEKLLHDPRGPLVVVGATRVSAPFGNAVLGTRLLQELGKKQTHNFGEALLNAKLQTVSNEQDSLLSSLRTLAAAVGGDPDSLDEEIVDHQHLYNLLGDPLLSIRRGQTMPLAPTDDNFAENKTLLKGVAPHDGTMIVEWRQQRDQPPTYVQKSKILKDESFVLQPPQLEAVKWPMVHVRVAIVNEDQVSVLAETIKRSTRLAESIPRDALVR